MTRALGAARSATANLQSEQDDHRGGDSVDVARPDVAPHPLPGLAVGPSVSATRVGVETPQTVGLDRLRGMAAMRKVDTDASARHAATAVLRRQLTFAWRWTRSVRTTTMSTWP